MEKEIMGNAVPEKSKVETEVAETIEVIDAVEITNTDNLTTNLQDETIYGLIKKVRRDCDTSADSLLDHLMSLKNRVDETYFEMGGVLRAIYDGQLYLDWGYSDWKTFVEERLQFKLRKAQYLISIWTYFAIELGDEEMIQKISKLGWSKAKELVQVVDPKNVDEWVRKAVSMTVTELSLEAAKKLRNMTDSDEIEKPPKLVSFKLYDEQFINVEDALKLAGEKSGSVIRSNNLSLMAIDFLVNNSGFKIEDGDSKSKSIAIILKSIELSLKIKIIAIDSQMDDVIYGSKYVQS